MTEPSEAIRGLQGVTKRHPDARKACDDAIAVILRLVRAAQEAER